MSCAAYFRAACVVVVVILMLVLSRPSALTPVASMPSAENVHLQMLNAMTFNRRWQLVVPTLPDVRDTTLRGDKLTLGPREVEIANTVPVAAAFAHEPPPRHHQAQAKPERADLCTRHGMRRVNYVKPNGWKYWRCRR